MKMTESIRRVSAITIAAALGMLTLIPADAASEEVAVMRHTTKPLPGYGTLTLEIWNDGTDVQVIGLDAEGRIVLAREGTMSAEPTFEGTGAIEGTLPAEQLSFDSHGAFGHERCATPSCARGIATMAESIVRASTMGAVEGADERTVMAKLCPSTGVDDAHAHAPTDALAALAANSPCKWRPVPIEDLAARGMLWHLREAMVMSCARIEEERNPQGQRSPKLKVIASNGRMLTGSSSFALAISSHCPS